MKHVLSTAIAAAAIFLIAGCEQFSTTYQRIDASEFRLLDFIYEPADIAPGDTLTLTAVFAGNKDFDLDNIEWWISFNVIHDLLFGTETVVDSTRLEPIARRVDTVFSPNTRAVSFRIKIPDDIARRSASIPAKWTDMLPASVAALIPVEFKLMSKNQVIDAVESYLQTAESGEGPSIENLGYVPYVLQFFTVPICVTAKIREQDRLPHTIRSSHRVRYNSRLDAAGIEGIPVNYNPVIKKVVVFKVMENITNIDDKDGLEYLQEIVLDNSGNSVIEVEKGYSYFLDALTDNLDYTLTLDGNRIREGHYVYRQFQLDSEEIDRDRIHHSKFMSFDEGGGKITFPSDERITKFTFWVTVKDEVMNELMRPEGSALAEVSGRFVYK